MSAVEVIVLLTVVTTDDELIGGCTSSLTIVLCTMLLVTSWLTAVVTVVTADLPWVFKLDVHFWLLCWVPILACILLTLTPLHSAPVTLQIWFLVGTLP